MGIDLGTSGLKTAIVDPEGHAPVIASREYRVKTPRPGWAEQEPDVWYQAAVETIRQALDESRYSHGNIAAIGFSGQMHGTVCLDAERRTLRPAIIWADQRSQKQVERLRGELGQDALGRWTGNPLATGFMLPTWLWLMENEIEVVQATRWLLLPKDTLRYRFTGQIGSEPSDASSTSLFDPVARRWSAPLLETLKIDPGLLPMLGESTQVAGELAMEVAEEVGLPPGTPVVYGGSDQACQALGHGVVEPGVVSCTIGTGGQLFAPLLNPSYDPQLRLHLFCHTMPDRWHLLAATLSAGLSLKWLRENILEDTNYQELADLASQVEPGAEGLFFLPYLIGERTPHMDPGVRGGFIGLALRHGRAHLVRAIMEGAVFALRQGLELMEAIGVPVGRVVASGGATRHPLWLQLQADIFNRPIYRTRTQEAAALGAALLAGVGVGIYPDPLYACRQAVRWRGKVVYPIEANVTRYEEMYRVFCRLYPSLKGVFDTAGSKAALAR